MTYYTVNKKIWNAAGTFHKGNEFAGSGKFFCDHMPATEIPCVLHSVVQRALYPAHPAPHTVNPVQEQKKLLVHDLVLQVDALEVDRFHNRLEEFRIQTELWSLGHRFIQDTAPATALQYRHIILFFDAPDLLGDPHPVAEQLKQFAVGSRNAVA